MYDLVSRKRERGGGGGVVNSMRFSYRVPMSGQWLDRAPTCSGALARYRTWARTKNSQGERGRFGAQRSQSAELKTSDSAACEQEHIEIYSEYIYIPGVMILLQRAPAHSGQRGTFRAQRTREHNLNKNNVSKQRTQTGDSSAACERHMKFLRECYSWRALALGLVHQCTSPLRVRGGAAPGAAPPNPAFTMVYISPG